MVETMKYRSLLCPVCREALALSERSLVCPRRHSFDLARSGYVNLLTNAARGGHGDNKEMIRARRDFLDTDAYAFLADAVTQAATDACRAVTGHAPLVFDAGCGEGYYTARVFEGVRETGADILGADISRDALLYAARRLPEASFFVASLYDLPLADASVDLLLLMFSPFAHEELLRVLRRGGRMVMAIPGRRHLYGMKELLYDTPYENEVADFAVEGFSLLSHTHLEKTVTFTDKTVIKNLYRMTPYSYRTGARGEEKLMNAASLTTPLSFEVLVYEKE